MNEPSVIHATFVIERNFAQSPERVFSAFSSPERKRRWFADSESHQVEEFVMEFQVGGIERFRYRLNESTPFPGVELTSEGQFLDIIPNQRLITASSMAIGGGRISASLVTIELLPLANGTDLICTNQSAFLENSDGPERREDGWRLLFDRLAADLRE